MKTLFTFAILLILVSLAFPQTDSKFTQFLKDERANLPVEGELLFDGAQLGSYSFGSSKKIVNADESLPFDKAFQLTVNAPGANPWEPQFQTPRNDVELNDGDVIAYIFYTRVLESDGANGFGQAGFYSQRATSPWTGLGSMSLTIRSEWQKLYIYVTAGENFDTNAVNATIHLGFVKQKVEISPIIALNLGNDIDTKELPTTPIYYEGMEPNAAWRAEAAARIEQHRKGDLTVLVKNKNGDPVKNANIHIEMQNHAYQFGTFMSTLALQDTDDANRYKDEVLNLFNCATTPFYMGSGTWGWYGPGDNQETYPALAEWLMDNDIPTKGHVLIWPSWQWMPPFFQDYENDPEGMQDAINEHLDTVVPIGADNELVEWDVVNEPHINHDVMDICGDEIMIDWYKYVHELHPQARLILNEYNILMGGGKKDFQDDFAYYIQLLLDGGAPLGGIGMQSHFGADLTDIPVVLQTLDRFAEFGLPIQITEFDIDILDEETQAAYTRDFFTAIFSHPATDKIVMWGFWQGDQWKPNGAMIRTDWTYKPNYDVYTDLVFNQWWTDETGASNRNGSYYTRAFLGEHKITVEFDGKSVSKNVTLAKDGAEIEIQIPTDATRVGDNGTAPVEYGLKQNYPNPFNNSTVIEFICKVSGVAQLDVFNSKGENVMTKKVDIFQDTPARQSISSNELASGVYLYSVKMPDNQIQNRKMLLIK